MESHAAVDKLFSTYTHSRDHNIYRIKKVPVTLITWHLSFVINTHSRPGQLPGRQPTNGDLDVTGIIGNKMLVNSKVPIFLNSLLTVHTGMILVNNQLDIQFFMYVYFYFVHVSGSHVSIIRRIIVSMRYLVYITLCRWLSGMGWPSGMQEHMLLHTRRSSTQSDINQVSHWYNNSPDDGHMAAWIM